MEDDTLIRFRRAYWQGLRELDAVRLQRWEHAQLTLPQLRVLLQVRRTPGITIGRLAGQLGVTVSTVSGLVTKLVDRGLVVRTPSAQDRRQLPLQVTETGAALGGELVDDVLPFLDAVAAGLGEDLAGVTAGLERVAAVAAGLRGEAAVTTEAPVSSEAAGT